MSKSTHKKSLKKSLKIYLSSRSPEEYGWVDFLIGGIIFSIIFLVSANSFGFKWGCIATGILLVLFVWDEYRGNIIATAEALYRKIMPNKTDIEK